MRRFDEELRLYSGTSFSIKLPGMSRSSGLVIRGETKGALLTSELFDRADEDRGRRLVIVSRASLYIQYQHYPQAVGCGPCVGHLKERNGG